MATERERQGLIAAVASLLTDNASGIPNALDVSRAGHVVNNWLQGREEGEVTYLKISTVMLRSRRLPGWPKLTLNTERRIAETIARWARTH